MAGIVGVVVPEDDNAALRRMAGISNLTLEQMIIEREQEVKSLTTEIAVCRLLLDQFYKRGEEA